MFERIHTLPVTTAPYAPTYIVERSTEPGAEFWDFRFTVIGKGDFPVDMLRRDECWPVDGDSAAYLIDDGDSRESRHVTLTSRQPRKLWLPTFERWQSFGWVVKSTAWEN